MYVCISTPGVRCWHPGSNLNHMHLDLYCQWNRILLPFLPPQPKPGQLGYSTLEQLDCCRWELNSQPFDWEAKISVSLHEWAMLLSTHKRVTQYTHTHTHTHTRHMYAHTHTHDTYTHTHTHTIHTTHTSVRLYTIFLPNAVWSVVFSKPVILLSRTPAVSMTHTNTKPSFSSTGYNACTKVMLATGLKEFIRTHHNLIHNLIYICLHAYWLKTTCPMCYVYWGSTTKPYMAGHTYMPAYIYSTFVVVYST